MSQYEPLPPAPPDHLPETPEFSRKSRYRKPRRYISWWGLLVGATLGILGGLYYAWVLQPVQEVDTTPRQLQLEDKAHYVVGIVLEYGHDQDIGKALEDLIALDIGPDPIQSVADIACNLASSNYIATNSGLRAVRSMKTLYQSQGRTGCADTLIPDVEDHAQLATLDVPTQTPTLVPPPSKTPTQSAVRTSATPDAVIVPTQPPQRNYTPFVQSTFCSVELSGTIEVYVQDFNGQGIPGQRIRVRWDEGQDEFFSGLKPERGPAFADFKMQAGKGYTIDMPGQSDPITTPLVADSCFTEDGFEALTSYRVIFRQN